MDARKTTRIVSGIPIQVISKEDLIALKETALQESDQEKYTRDLMALQA